MSACACVLSHFWPVHHGPSSLSFLPSVPSSVSLCPSLSRRSLPVALFLSLILAANAILTLNSQEQEFEVRISQKSLWLFNQNQYKERCLFFFANFFRPQDDDAFVPPPSEITPSHRQSMSQTHYNEHITCDVHYLGCRERKRERDAHTLRQRRAHTHIHTQTRTHYSEGTVLVASVHTFTKTHDNIRKNYAYTFVYFTCAYMSQDEEILRARVCTSSRTHAHTFCINE